MSEEYDRGVQDQRLHGHDEHFKRINGSQAEVARELGELKVIINSLRLDLHRLTDAVEANQKTAIATAIAVEPERRSTAEAIENQRVTLRDSTEKRWSPLARVVSGITIAAALSGFITWLISLHG